MVPWQGKVEEKEKEKVETEEEVWTEEEWTDDEEDVTKEDEQQEQEQEDLPLLETPDNPLGYKLPRVRMNEHSDWTKLLIDMKPKHRKTGNYYAKRFIRQVRESRGYDVDCYVSGIFMSPFRPEPNFKEKEDYYPQVKAAAQHAVHKLNCFRELSHYKLVDVQKVVASATYRLLLLTFTVKEVGGANAYRLDEDYFYRDEEADESTELNEIFEGEGEEENMDKGESEDKDDDDGEGEGTILTCQATVDACWGRKCKGLKLKELRVKPVTNAVLAA